MFPEGLVELLPCILSLFLGVVVVRVPILGVTAVNNAVTGVMPEAAKVEPELAPKHWLTNQTIG